MFNAFVRPRAEGGGGGGKRSWLNVGDGETRFTSDIVECFPIVATL